MATTEEVNSITTHGAGVVAIHNNTVLLVQMNYSQYKGQWILPGGMVNEGEHPHDGAVREFKEESNLDIKLTKLLCVRHRKQKKRMNNTYWVFTGDIITPDPTSQIKWPQEELMSVKFWDINEALSDSTVRPHTQHYIKYLIQKESLPVISSLESQHDDICYMV